MCDYQRGTVECTGTGLLWDADNDGWSEDFNEGPCPKCNTKVYIEQAKEEAESTVDGNGMSGYYTGESLWLGAVRVAVENNASETANVLAKLGVVEPLVPADNDEGYESRRYLYQ